MNCEICNKKLQSNNKIGMCRKHRFQSKARKEYYRNYVKNNKEKIANIKKKHQPKATKRFLERIRNDVQFRLRHILRTRVNKILNCNSKTGSAVSDLGCSVEFLKSYLESKFLPGMSWENHGINGWHIDHIIPLSSVDLSDREQFLKVCHYTNLQPLWSIDNIKKRDRI